MKRIKKATRILSFLFNTIKIKRIKSAESEEKKSFYESLSNLALINDTLYQSHSA